MNVSEIYHGSNGQATKDLYRQLESIGAIGTIAMNLFRAKKCSERAKKYRGGIKGKGSYRSMAYARKSWSIDNLCEALETHANALGIKWGWKVDPLAEAHVWVLYVVLPGNAGQVSFHSARRGKGPDYSGRWDGIRCACANRVITWVSLLLRKHQARQTAMF